MLKFFNANVAAKLTNMKVEICKKLNKSPFKFYGGFLPQVVTNDPKQRRSSKRK